MGVCQITGKIILLILMTAVLCSCKDANIESSRYSKKQAFEKRYDKYSTEESKIIKLHVNKALSLLPSDVGELEIVAVINDYVYQYFVNKNNHGGAAKLLKEGYAICGGSAVTMAEMLYSVNVKSRLAFLIGIPNQGAHSLVEVYFKNGECGLFDPTFGIFWYDHENDKPVSIIKLLEDPKLSNVFLYKSIHKKREKTNEEVIPAREFLQTYQNKPSYKEKYYNPYLCFLKRSGGGVAGEEYKTYVKIPMKPGSLYGNRVGSSEEPSPFNKLALLKNQEGKNISWAYMLGKTGRYNISHIY